MSISQTLLEQNGAGFVWLLEVSVDKFATVDYRYATNTVNVGGHWFDGRISDMGNISSGFGTEALPAPLTADLTIANVDGLADWLCDRTAAAYINTARFRLSVAMWDATQSYTDNPTFQTQQVGVFSMFDWPKRTNSTIKLSLADDAATRITELLVAPTLRDWMVNALTTGEQCPLVDFNPIFQLDIDLPLPIAFGVPSLAAYCAANEYNNITPGTVETSSAGGASHLCIPICVTTNTDPVTVNDINQLSVVFAADFNETALFPELIGASLGIPRNARVTITPTNAGTVWEVRKSKPISKSGTSWCLIWVDFNAAAWVHWFETTYAKPRHLNISDQGDTSQLATDFPTGKGLVTSVAITTGPAPQGTKDYRYAAMYAIDHFVVGGFPLSARTVPTQLNQNAADVIQDLISYYAEIDDTGFLTSIDASSFAKAKAATSQLYVGGVIGSPPLLGGQTTKGPQPDFETGALRRALQEICQSADFDLYVRRLDGKFAIACNAHSYDDIIATHPIVEETRVDAFEERRPSQGERWAPYNRIFVTDANNATSGPYDNPVGLTALGGRPRARTIQAKWLVLANSPVAPDYLLGIWGLRNLDTKVRPLIRFRTDKTALQLDLASLFSFTWSRGALGGPYNDSVFSVERWVMDPRTLSVDMEAVWVDDINSEHSYLLDDNQYLLKQTGSSSRTVQVVNASSTLTFSSGSLITDAIAAGDIIVLNDTTESDEGMQRNRAMRIASITDATHLVVAETDLDFAGGATTSAWRIERGFVTYPTAVSDPVNYPAGGAMYGKACADTDSFSDFSTANAMKEG